MKSIRELILHKELEIQQLIESSVREKENELRQLRKVLQQALSILDHLLEDASEEGNSIEDTVETTLQALQFPNAAHTPQSPLPSAAIGSTRAAAGNGGAGSEFP